MSPFLAWGDFHAPSRFASSTIPDEKWGTTRSLDRQGRSLHNENVTFNESYPARSDKCLIVCMKEIVFHQKLLEKAYFIFKMSGAAIVRPASYDFWKVV